MPPLLPLLLNYWKPILKGICAIACITGILWFGYRWGVRVEHDRGQKSLSAQIAADAKQCNNDKQITEEVSSEHQRQIIDLRNQLDSIKRVRPNACIPVHVANSPSGHNDTPANSQFPKPDGSVDSYTLLDFAYDSEQIGLQLDACQNFIKATWKSKGQ